MTERATLLAAALNSPSDNNARLVLSDWLEEHGEVAFGRFLRAGVVASKYRGERVVEDRAFYDALGVLAEVAESRLPGRWVSELGLGSSPSVLDDWLWDTDGHRVTVRQGETTGLYSRGLLTGLRVGLVEWFSISRVALGRWPLEWVEMRDAPGLRVTIRAPDEGGGGQWTLGVEFRSQDRRSRARGKTHKAAVEYPTRGDLIEGVPVAVVEMIVDVRRQSLSGGGA